MLNVTLQSGQNPWQMTETYDGGYCITTDISADQTREEAVGHYGTKQAMHSRGELVGGI